MDRSTDSATPAPGTDDGNKDGQPPGDQRTRKHKRPRLVLSCTECVRRKTKCDRHVPCGACVKRGDASKCRVDEVDEAPVQPFALSSEHVALKKRVAFLESILKTQNSDVIWPGPMLKTSFVPGQEAADSTAIIHGSVGSSTSSPANHAPQAGPSRPRKERSRSDSLDSGTENAAMTLEMIALGKSKRAQDETTTTPSLDEALRKNLYAGEMLKSAPQGDREASSLFVGEDRRREEDLAYLRSVVPSREMSRKLIDSYINRVDFTYHTLHHPSFFIEVDEFWQLVDTNRFNEVDPAWLALYLMVACLGMYFLANDPQISADQQRALPPLWFAAAQRALHLADWTGKPQLRCVAAILHFTLYLLNVGEVERLVIWVSSALRIAQILGLHKLNDSNNVVPNDPLAYASGSPLLKREMGKRLFWLLVYVEWNVADRSLGIRGIRPEDFQTSPPKNFEDEDLMSADPVEQPLSVPTRVSYEIFRIDLIGGHQSWMLEQRAKPQTYEGVLEMDNKLHDKIAQLPVYFHPDRINDPEVRQMDRERPYLTLQRCVVNLGLHNRIMRLHRPYLTRGCKDETFALSAKRCVQSARMVLASIRVFRSLCDSCDRFWFVCFYTFSSALVLLVHSLATELSPADARENHQEVLLAITALRAQSGSSVIAKSGVRVLEGLLQERPINKRAAAVGPATVAAVAAGTRRRSTRHEPDYVRDVLNKMVRTAERSTFATTSTPPPTTRSPEVEAFRSSPSSSGANGPLDLFSATSPTFSPSDVMLTTAPTPTYDEAAANELLRNLGFMAPAGSSSPSWPAGGLTAGLDAGAMGFGNDLTDLSWIDGLGGTV